MIPLAIESGRRMAGWPLTILVVIIGFYPLFSEHMPGILYGPGVPWETLAPSFAYGRSGLLGIPARVMGDILIGFLMFAGVMMASGAGKFFLDLATALMGRYRGGPAKVAVVASGFFGSLTSNGPANVIVTGSFTIPAMKRLGYPPHYAGAVEAVASNGGTIMPPVMGSTIFLIVILAEIPYAAIMVGAFIPALLYYFGLLMQVDGYAARTGLKGLSPEEIPSLKKTLKSGWQYLAVIAFLVFGLIYMRWGVIAPIYAAGLLLLFSFTSRETMITPRKLVGILATVGNLITYLIAVFLPIGLIMIGVETTGTITALTIPIAQLGGTNILAVLMITFVICYLFGMVGIISIPYVILAALVLPSLIEATGLNELSIHLFTAYLLNMASITPPVCITAFVAAGVSGAPPFKTAFTAMRLAVVVYFIPFFFVFNPALILQGPILRTLYLFVLCLVGIWILASGLEGYLLKVGRLTMWSRALLVAGGFLIAFPDWMMTIAGAVIAAVVIAFILITKKTVAPKLANVS